MSRMGSRGGSGQVKSRIQVFPVGLNFSFSSCICYIYNSLHA